MASDRFVLTHRYLKDVVAHRAAFWGMLLCMVVVGLLQPLLPWMLAPLLDANAGNKDYFVSSQWLPFLMLGVVIVLGVFSYGRSYLGGWLDATMQREYREKMSAHLLNLPVHRLQDNSTGLMTSRFMLFLSQMTGATMPVCMGLVQETIRAVGYLSLMLYWQWQLTLLVLVIAPIGASTIRVLGKRIKKVAAKSQKETALIQNRLNETIAGAQVIKLSGKPTAIQRLSSAFHALRGSVIRMHIVLSAGQPLTHILISIPFAVIIALVIDQLADGAMSPGEAASFLTVMLLLPTPVRVFTRSMHKWEQMLVAAREIYGFLDESPEVDVGEQTINRAKGEITLENVCFKYKKSEQTVFDSLSLTIQAGEKVALVGRSGSGKTTLCNLLPRFFQPQSGSIAIDGTPIEDFKLESLRQQFAIVTQKPVLFDDTVAMNVAFPDAPDADLPRLTAALKNAAADEFVNELPNGINTLIGENGNTLSGGQQQRLMIARAFYRDAPIVILDESTSALDSETEKKIKVAMQRLLAGRTAVVIAHRFATIDICDRVIVLDNGTVLASGTIEELRQTCPLFEELYVAQSLL